LTIAKTARDILRVLASSFTVEKFLLLGGLIIRVLRFVKEMIIFRKYKCALKLLGEN